MNGDIVEHCNKTVWHFPEIVLPSNITEKNDMILEVDPAYVEDAEE